MTNPIIEEELKRRNLSLSDRRVTRLVPHPAYPQGTPAVPQNQAMMGPPTYMAPTPTAENFRVPNPAELARLFQQMNLGSVQKFREVADDRSVPGIDHETMTGDLSLERYREVAQRMQGHIAEQYGVQLAQGQQVQRLPVDAFLRTIFVEGKVIEKMAPQLMFLDLADRATSPSKDVQWFRHKYSPDTDPALKRPVPHKAGDVYARTLVSDPEVQHLSLGTFAIAIEFTDEALRLTAAPSEINRKLGAVSYSMAKDQNILFSNVLMNNFDVNQVGFDADSQIIVEQAPLPWSDPDSNPIEDFRDIAEAMETTDGFFFEATEAHLHTTNYRELLDFATSVDHPWSKDPFTGERVLMVDNIRIVKAPPNSGIPEGSAVVLARGPGVDPPLTVWEMPDPRFTTSGVVEVREFEDPETLNRTFIFQKTYGAANRNPKAVGHLAGI